jgi:4-amino-4-deoxy-L-arabinose transferase-like glycosyltransferase
VFWLALAGYLGMAAYLVFAAHVSLGDGLARVENAERIVFSHDPHLAAVGFIWSPLPTLTLLPLLALKGVWPALAEMGFAGNVMSAVFMAGAVSQVRGFFADLTVSRPARLWLTAAFALHPMVIFYGANAMSEAFFLFFLLMTVRYLARWCREGGLAPLVYTGLALSGAYLTRYEAVAAAVAAVLIVAIVSLIRSRSDFKDRIGMATYDAAVLLAPFAVTFVVWALSSWLITGIAFQQLASIYGTTAQLRAQSLSGLPLTGTRGWAFDGMRSILAFQLCLPIVAGLAAIRAVRRRDLGTVAVIGVLGAVLGFMLFAYANGTILRSQRYFIVAVPLGVLLAALALDPAGSGQRFASTIRSIALTTLALLALPVAGAQLLSASTATTHFEAAPLRAALSLRPLPASQLRVLHRFDNDRRVANYLDGLTLPGGSVLLDDFIGYPIVLASRHPEQFVITSDRDFTQALADPAGSGIRYLLVPPQSGLGALDAINRSYPNCYADASCKDSAVLVSEFDDTGDQGRTWRLYAVLPPTTSAP